MPHVIVKLYTGRSEQQKKHLADEVTKAVMSSLGFGEDSVSVAVEEVAPARWAEDVYKPDILDKPEQIYKTPGYNPFGCGANRPPTIGCDALLIARRWATPAAVALAGTAAAPDVKRALLRALAEQAISTPSLDAFAALVVLTDALLESGILKPTPEITEGFPTSFPTWSVDSDVRFDPPTGSRWDATTDRRTVLETAAFRWAWASLATDDALAEQARARLSDP